MRTAPLAPSVELLLGPRSAVLGAEDACGLTHPLVELRMRPRSAALRGGDACRLPTWGRLWNSLRGHETLYWVGEAHAACAPGTVGGDGATNRCAGWGGRSRAAPLGPL
eukprot:8771942-Pyramimonas_sp.AAC.1